MARDTDFLTSTIVLYPGAGERGTATQRYRYRCEQETPQEVLGAVHLDRLIIQSTSAEAFRQLAGLCTQVAERMEQTCAEAAEPAPGAAAPEAGEGLGR